MKINMKSFRSRILLFFVAISVMISFFACNIDQSPKTKQFADGRVFVYEFTSENVVGTYLADYNTLEAVTELSSQFVKCRINKTNHVEYTDTNRLSFEYEVEILDIYLNIDNRIAIGDVIRVVSSEGMMKAREAAALLDESRAEKLGILREELYLEDEYVTSSAWDAIPIEVGKTYLMFLTDDYLETEGVYVESGLSYLYEYDDQTVYCRNRMFVSDLTTGEILSQMQAQIEKRTGRADEVGRQQYLVELGEKQRQEAA